MMDCPTLRLAVYLLPICLVGCGGDALQEISPKDGQFKVKMPKDYKVDSKKFNTDSVLITYAYAAANRGYFLDYHDDKNILEDESFAQKQKRLENSRDVTVRDAQGKLTSSTAIKLNELHPGLDYTFTNSKNHHIRGRSYLVKNRLFNMRVFGDEKFINSSEANEFLNSFQYVP